MTLLRRFPCRKDVKVGYFTFFFSYGTAKKSTSFITHVLRYFFLLCFATSTFYVLKLPGKNKICGPEKIETLVIELLQNFFLKTLMSVVWENTNVIQMLNVAITLDPTAANVKKDFQEMAKRARVSVDYYPSAILYKSRAAFLS